MRCRMSCCGRWANSLGGKIRLTLMKGDEGVELAEEGADSELLGKRRHPNPAFAQLVKKVVEPHSAFLILFYLL